MVSSRHPHHTDSSKSTKVNTLNIRLTESAVFLPTDGIPTHRGSTQPDSRNAMLRGLLILELVNPTKISSIEVELSVVTSTAWPEGIGARRIDITEDHRVFHASATYFNGSKTSARRTVSIGPGVAFSGLADSPYIDGEVGNDFDSEVEDVRAHFLHPESHILDAALSRSRSRGGTRRNLNNNSQSFSHGNQPPPELQAGPSNYAQSQLVYSNQSTSPLPLHRGDSTSTAHSRYSIPFPQSRIRTTRRLSADSSQFQRMPIYESYHDASELEERLRHEGEILPPIPPYSPYPESPPSSGALGSPTGPAQQSLEDSFHSSLRNSQVFQSQSSLPSGSPTANSTQSLHSPPGRSLSRRPSLSEVIPENDEIAEPTPRFPSPARHQHSRSPPASRSTRPESHSQSRSRTGLSLSIPHGHPPALHDQQDHPPSSAIEHERGRKSSRFSFSAVTTILMDAVRTSSPKTSRITASRERPSEIGRERSIDVARELRRRGRTTERQGTDRTITDHEDTKTKAHEPEERGRGLISKILKEKDKGGEKGKSEGWKEFKKGTYTYPISFSIPSNTPPTMLCDYGTVTWRLKANVHRPGAFKPKMTAVRDVITIACPTEEDTEDTENIIVERHWEQQLQYLISVSGRSFYIGGTMPVTITLMPLAKIKIHRLSVYIEERVDYYTNMRRIARTDPLTKCCLLTVKNEGKCSDPILPLDSDCPDALRNSPLYSIIDPNLTDNELSETASALMGPGPWTFHQDLQLPKSCDQLRPTNRNRRSNIIISHTLKVVMRVERGDNTFVDKTGKRKMFDIVVQTPVLILSCRCNPEWTSLPRYAEAFDDSASIVPSCPCQVARNQVFNEHTVGFRTNSVTAALERVTSRHSSGSSGASAAETSPVNTSTMRSLRHTTYNESILRSSSLFERLISGQENETGETPPSYDSASRLLPIVESTLPMPLGDGVSAR